MIRPPPHNQIQQPITDKNTAIRTLNYLVGVEVLPGQQASGCLANWAINNNDHAGPQNNNYFVQSQCTDTNTGEAILDATSVLTDARWMRRESVWTMVMLTDGYPNHTTSQMNSTNLGGASDHNWLNVFEPSQFGQPLPTVDTCDPASVTCVCNPDYGTQPAKLDYSATNNGVNNPALTTAGNPTGAGGFVAQYGYVICTGGVGGKRGGPNLTLMTTGWNENLATANRIPFAYTGDDSGQIKTSYGFCPWWTFCHVVGSDLNSQICQQVADGYPGTKYPVGTPLYQISNAPYRPNSIIPDPRGKVAGFSQPCDASDPFARHFCSNMDGSINPGGAIENSALCDPHYDPMDYARDRADFAGLLNYTPTVPGDFIAMFGILFQHNNINSQDASIGGNMLGVQFLHYLSDAGDNGQIDNHLQAWYRKHHFNNTALNEGPTRLPQEWTNFSNLTYDGRNGPGTFFTNDKLTDPEDPCAQFDYPENTGPTVGTDLALNYWAVGTIPPDATNGTNVDAPGGNLYEANAKQTCGQYFFANNLSTINTAFTEIAGRLFTRLAR